jgi:hypothetical protein
LPFAWVRSGNLPSTAHAVKLRSSPANIVAHGSNGSRWARCGEKLLLYLPRDAMNNANTKLAAMLFQLERDQPQSLIARSSRQRLAHAHHDLEFVIRQMDHVGLRQRPSIQGVDDGGAGSRFSGKSFSLDASRNALADSLARMQSHLSNVARSVEASTSSLAIVCDNVPVEAACVQYRDSNSGCVVASRGLDCATSFQTSAADGDSSGGGGGGGGAAPRLTMFDVAISLALRRGIEVASGSGHHV